MCFTYEKQQTFMCDISSMNKQAKKNSHLLHQIFKSKYFFIDLFKQVLQKKMNKLDVWG